MKKICTILAIFLLQLSYAQDVNGEKKEKEISFDNLEVPNTPAFILQDEAPTSIQRPNSTRAFALDLLQDVTEDGVLGNIAVEVTPFWMIRHTNVTPEKYYGIITEEDGSVSQNFFSKLRLASVSAAYMKSADSITNISIGVRTTLFEIKRQDDIKAYKDRSKDKSWSDISDLVEVLPYLVAHPLALYVAQTESRTLETHWKTAIESMLTFISYVCYCDIKSTKSNSGIYLPANFKRSAGPLRNLLSL